jgi:hypothetical protein
MHDLAHIAEILLFQPRIIKFLHSEQNLHLDRKNMDE